jgi:hypothetical protein
MNRVLTIALAAAGPFFVAALRMELPYFLAPNGTVAATAVAAQPGTESLVLWLGFGATLTLVPGLVALWRVLPPSRLATIGLSLALIGYLCVPALLATDLLLWLGADQALPAEVTGGLVDGAHPTALIGAALFVPTHLVGIVLIGVLALRRHLLPPAAAWALTLSQPLHLTSVLLGLQWLDPIAWGLTGIGMGWLAAALTKASVERAPAPALT